VQITHQANVMPLRLSSKNPIIRVGGYFFQNNRRSFSKLYECMLEVALFLETFAVSSDILSKSQPSFEWPSFIPK
jgi:hypothetical protein